MTRAVADSRKIVVRPATRADVPAIVRVSNSSVSEKEDSGFGTPRSESPFADAARLSVAWRDPNRVRGEEVLVAELNDRVVGCVTIEDRTPDLELINIDVPRKLQGRGIGTQMVRFVEERARREGKRSVTLGTSRNAAGVAWKSLPWWQSLGYEITGEEENTWTRRIGPGVREIRMRKEIRAEHQSTPDLVLRDVIDQDLSVFFEFQRDPTASYMAAFVARDPSDRDAFDAHWTRIRKDPTITMKTILVGGKVAGSVACYTDEHLGKPEVTYWIGREFWGKGVATTALSRFLEIVATRPIYGRAARDNVASLRVLEKCGFKLQGYERSFAGARGKEIEEAILRLDTAL